MNSLKTLCLIIGLIALATANQGPRPMRYHDNRNSIKNSLKPTEWISVSELESLPALYEKSIEDLEKMTVLEGADFKNKLYHLSQAGQAIVPSVALKANEISAYLITSDNKKVNFKLNELPEIVKEHKDFGKQEVTIFITGLSPRTDTIKKAYSKLVQAYMQRYNGQWPEPHNVKYDDELSMKYSPSSSEEDYSAYAKNRANEPSGSLVVIEMGNLISADNYYYLDVEKTGMEIADILVKLTDEGKVPHEIIHVIGSQIAAHVAGAVGRHYFHDTGHQLRRITGLDPSKLFAQSSKALRGLSRGDAEFVDVIHTSAYGFGIPNRCGDVDFYPGGPDAGVPGADNIIEATMRAIRYYAETVIPGNERNFPAASGISLKEYKDQKGYVKHAYMGIDTDYDLKGDYILQVNAKSPFGRSALYRPQNNHYAHKP